MEINKKERRVRKNVYVPKLCRFIAPALLLCVLLHGCAKTCPVPTPPGGLCISPEQAMEYVDNPPELYDEMTVPYTGKTIYPVGAPEENEVAKDNFPLLSNPQFPSPALRGSGVTLQGQGQTGATLPLQLPIKQKPKILCVWIPPGETPDGRFIAETRICSEVPGRWMGVYEYWVPSYPAFPPMQERKKRERREIPKWLP